jgi:hypothetical protein
LQARERHSHDFTFRPEVFFLGRTEGAGIDRDLLGRTRRRCTIFTEGVLRASMSAICVDEVMTYDDGEVQKWRWVLGDAGDGRYLVAEARAGSGHMVERRADGDFVISFRRTRDWISHRHVTRYTMLDETLSMESTTVSLLGVPRTLFTAIRRRVAD